MLLDILQICNYRTNMTDQKTQRFWTVEEKRILRNELMKGKTFDELMNDLPDRSANAIRIQAMQMIREEIKTTGKQTEETLDKYHVEVSAYKYFLENEGAQKPKPKKKETIASLTKRIEELEERVKKLEIRKRHSKK
jgi:hypothetical protein